MSCEANVCGTGGWGGPKPGDPSNDINIRAVSAFGGIDILWSFPTTNPFALAYGVMYRGLSADFNGAMPIGQDTDGFYHDRVEPGVLYYYWVQAVSINGTFGEVIGPASAVAKSTIEQTMRDLTGKIDAGVLAQALKAEIDRIPMIGLEIQKEVDDRMVANAALEDVLAQFQTDLGQTMTYVQNEIIERRDGDSALVNQINTLAASVDQNAAAILEEKTVRVTKTDALATSVTTLQTTVGDSTSGLVKDLSAVSSVANAAATDITSLATTVGDANSGLIQKLNSTASTASAAATLATTLQTTLGDASSGVIKDLNSVTAKASSTATDVTQLYTTVGDANSGLIQKLNSTTTTADSAASAVSTLTSTVGDASSGLVQKLNTQASDLGTLSSSVTTLNSTVNGNSASGEVGLTTKITTAEGKIKDIGAMYTARLSVNGLIGGFGVYNDGKTVEAGFDVDTFWVGRTSSDWIKPFIIVGGTTYINDAAINKLTFSKLRSDDGSVIVENGKLKAAYLDADNITAKKIDLTSGGGGAPRTTMTNGLIQVFHGNGNLAVRLGIW
jgi:hypothetical protein